MNYQIKRCAKKEFENICDYVSKLNVTKSNGYNIEIKNETIVAYLNNGRIYCIYNSETESIEGICLLMFSKKTNGVLIPLYYVDSIHRSKLSNYVLIMEIAKYIGNRTIAIQFNKKVESRNLIDCGNNIYSINKPIALKNPIYKFLHDTFLEPDDMIIDENIISFQKQYAIAFPEEKQPYTLLIKQFRNKCDIKFEGKYNLVYLQLSGSEYKIIGEWALANKSMSMSENKLALKEGLEFAKTLKHPIDFTGNFNSKYIGILNKVNNRIKKDI